MTNIINEKLAMNDIILSVKANIYAEHVLIISIDNFKIYSGQFHLIRGSNGSGKSSILNAIFQHPDYELDGSITIENNIEFKDSLEKFVNLGYFYIPQKIPVIENLTYRYLWDAMQEKFNYSFDWEMINSFTNLAHNKMDYSVGDCSGGENKVMELIPFLSLPNMKCLFLDEIDSSLDESNINVIKSMIKTLLERNIAICIVTHHNSSWNDMINHQYTVFDNKIKHE